MKKLIKYITLMLLTVISSNAWAQAEKAVIKNDYMKDVASEVVYIFMAVCILILLLTIALWSAVKAVEEKLFGVDEEALLEEGKITEEDAEKIKYEKRGFWERFFKAKPPVTDKDVMLDHDYDGIRELDNPAPPWFMFLFYGTIAFAVIYLLVYHVFMTAPLQIEEYENQVAQAEVEIAAYLAEAADRVDENTVVVLTDEATIAKGRAIFEVNCVSCHGPEGQGTQVPVSIGPNLVDDYWINGGDIQSVFKTIKYGVVEKGMRAWGEVLSPSEMQQVASYIFSQHGKVLDNAKGPQGELLAPSGDSITTDTIIVDTLPVMENAEISMIRE